MSITDQYVVLDREAWVALVAALAEGDPQAAAVAALGAQVPGEVFVLRETDVLAPQALYGYAATIRTAVEFTEQHGLSVMTDEVSDRLTNLANDVTQMGCDWHERQTSASATIQASDYGIMEP